MVVAFGSAPLGVVGPLRRGPASGRVRKLVVARRGGDGAHRLALGSAWPATADLGEPVHGVARELVRSPG